MGTRIKELSRLFNSLQKQTNQDFEVIVASQENHEKVQECILSFQHLSITHIKLNKKGLSYARNKAIPYVNGEIITFSDDDCWYPENMVEKVQSYFLQNHADILTGKIFDPDKNEYYKNYPEIDQKNIKISNILRKSSIEIFINLQKVSKEVIKFDEQFGLGAKYGGGEEIILLMDLHKKGFKIDYLNTTLVFHRVKEKQEFLLSDNIMEIKGALFRRNFNYLVAMLLGFAFYFKKIKYINGKTNGIILLFKGLNYNEHKK